MNVQSENATEPAGAGAARREVVAIEVSAPPGEVWGALRDLSQLHQWFGWDYDGLDAEIELIFATEAVEGADGEVRTVAWPDGDAIAVAPSEGGTRLTISRTAPGSSPESGPDEIDEGWIQFAHQLRFMLERSPEGPRRTVSAIDLDGGPVGAGPVYRLGVAASDGVPVGGRWEVTRTIGTARDQVGGRIWYRTKFQAGYTVEDPAGEALLVVQRVPVTQRPPHGRVSLVMSTFGLDDETFAAVQRRWTTWWSGA
ncbi:SRPBCC family protein [Pengzhenrongella sicca]|uniref:SRPBCC domain-containing protein n=1 Tax=Pengzhenrongella sicca TaxID=2819238 RepID=A0A8A4ZBN9_9MICO|nr:hypothetical protein [Pengzhenrongella sicca]QTE29332.1 hypothetical protein J4E96_19000 [Pengzhenrongella sicca]